MPPLRKEWAPKPSPRISFKADATSSVEIIAPDFLARSLPISTCAHAGTENSNRPVPTCCDVLCLVNTDTTFTSERVPVRVTSSTSKCGRFPIRCSEQNASHPAACVSAAQCRFLISSALLMRGAFFFCCCCVSAFSLRSRACIFGVFDICKFHFRVRHPSMFPTSVLKLDIFPFPLEICFRRCPMYAVKSFCMFFFWRLLPLFFRYFFNSFTLFLPTMADFGSAHFSANA
mmetsp:Transcript_75517/g.87790  ORF Transcript_75517/g.87790 Transcript_75517/m.87790 type:complete len:231 (-) Transcript_75517:757-1449(-)